MNIGYACLALAVPGSGMKSCALKNAAPERLLSLIKSNIDALEKLIDYNIRSGIRLFRISSDLIPFGSLETVQVPWRQVYSERLSAIGQKILRSGMRVSMHPGQYTVLNSPDPLAAKRAAADLHYHAAVLDALGVGSGHKIILHLGGAYGNKKEARNRFLLRYRQLEPEVQSRLALENDDRIFTIRDVLDTAAEAGIPAVYDNLHNAANPSGEDRTDPDWIGECSKTWQRKDGAQKIHYSQQDPCKKKGAHSESILTEPFLAFCRPLINTETDIMLEVKDKNLSAVKCILCVSNPGIGALEAEWARYKYCVLERSSESYLAIRRLLKEKSGVPALSMYRLIEAALRQPAAAGDSVNAASHVWGYFKNRASEAEKKRFLRLLHKFSSGANGIQPVKNCLWSLAEKYGEDYLLNGYYFYL